MDPKKNVEERTASVHARNPDYEPRMPRDGEIRDLLDRHGFALDALASQFSWKDRQATPVVLALCARSSIFYGDATDDALAIVLDDGARLSAPPIDGLAAALVHCFDSPDIAARMPSDEDTIPVLVFVGDGIGFAVARWSGGCWMTGSLVEFRNEE